jgi:hypothetical protein
MPKVLTGISKVSNYQCILIRKCVELGSRRRAAEELGINPHTVDDAMFRAYRALGVNDMKSALELIDKGVRSAPATTE